MKDPVAYHSLAYQSNLVTSGTREQIIEWLRWNDPNGTYTDADSVAETMLPITLDQAQRVMLAQISRL